MSLTNPNTPVSQQDLQDFYHKLLPYMGGSSTGGGHTIEDSEGTELEQREVLQFGEGFKAEDDDTNEKTVISPDVMQSGDMSDVVTTLPYMDNDLNDMPILFDESGTEKVVGWYKYANGTKKPVYEKSIQKKLVVSTSAQTAGTIANLDKVIKLGGTIIYTTNVVAPYVRTHGDSSKPQDVYIGNQGVINCVNKNYEGTAYLTIQYTKTTDTAE